MPENFSHLAKFTLVRRRSAGGRFQAVTLRADHSTVHAGVVPGVFTGSDVEGVRIFSSTASGVRVIINDSVFRDTDRANENRPALNIFNVGAGPTRVTITNNRIYDNPRGGIGLAGGAAASGVVMDNQVFGNGATGIRVSGDFVVARNVAQGNATNYDLANAPNAAPISSL